MSDLPALAPVTAVPSAANISVRPTGNGKTPAETAEAFEAVFIGQITSLMMATAGTGGEFSGGSAEEMYRGMLAERIGDAIAKRGGIGLAPAVADQIIKMQGGNNGN